MSCLPPSGTVALFYPGYDSVSAALYTIGSSGFLFVDVQEWITFSGAVLRTNILMSMTGSFLYLVGSIGFFPVVVAFNPLIGIWGFVLGSAFIGFSQVMHVRPAHPSSTLPKGNALAPGSRLLS